MSAADDLRAAFQVFNEIGIIEHLSRTEFERVLPEDLSVAGFSVLNHFVRLNKTEDAPARLARAFQVTKGAMTYTLQRLEDAGHITIGADPCDGRGKVVCITEKGRAAREDAIARLTPLLSDLLKAFDGKSFAAMLPALARLRAILDARRD
ncbi:MAG: MarR family transcriptional regulator [Alphaproteobacteria bacterium]|nr:MarR family transcriptional regulator [Alphaproteobacteria bacterium]